MPDNAITWFDDFTGPNPHSFLSNFALTPLQIGHLTFATGEHAFQAAKASWPIDAEVIRLAVSPGMAKRFGRACSLRRDWEMVKHDVMRSVLRAKFTRGSDLAQMLLDTGDAALIEGAHWNDRIWGVDADMPTLPGDNWLGTLLMARRAELRAVGTSQHLDVLDRIDTKLWEV